MSCLSKRGFNIVLLLVLFVHICVLPALASGQVVPITVTLNGEQTHIEAQTGLEANLQTGQADFGVNADLSFISHTGQPQIPFRIMRLLLPPNARLDTLTSQLLADYRPVEGTWDVAPMPPMASRDQDGNEIVIWPAGRTFVDGCDIDIYEVNAFWPPVEAHLMNTGRLRSYQLAEFAVPLYRYNPVTGQLLELAAADFTVNTRNPNKNAFSDTSGKSAKRENSKINNRLKNLTVNFEQAAAGYEEADTTTTDLMAQPAADDEISPSPTLTDTGYVIITSNVIKNASTKLNAFVAHKQSLNYTVSVITETQYGSGTGDTAANNIRAWLQANYNNSAYGSGGILYVLLIGDPRTTSSSVPMKMCLGDHPTDYFYAELSSDWDANGNGIFGESEDINGEKYFEVYIGRIPYYGTISHTDSILQKIMNYENATDTNWRRKALLPMVPLDDSTPAYQMGEQIKYNLLEPKAIPSTRIYEDNYGVNPPPEYTFSEQYPATEWSKNIYGMVIWQTHGWDQGAAGIITTGDTAGLNNNYPAAVWQGSCMNGQPETTTNLGYSILKNGGIGTVAASRNGWYYVGQTSFTNTSSVGGMGYQYARRITERKTLGQALWDTKETLSYWDKNYFVYNLYGDPSVTVMPPVPDFTITPTHGLYFNIAYGGTTTVASTYTLKNNGTGAVSWTAEKGDASWYDLSAYSGSINAQGTAAVSITLNNETTELPVGTYQDIITFVNPTDDIMEERTVTLHVYPKRKIAYWPLDETAGTTASDVSGNGHDGTVTNTDFTASVTGKFAAALYFDGSDDHIEVPGFTEDISELTISAWIKADDWNGNRRIIQKGSDGSEYRLLIENSRFIFEMGSTRLEITTLPATGTWVHLAAVYDGTTMNVYYDKVLVGSRTRSGMVPTSSNALYIGSKNAGAPAGDRFKGAMDEVRIDNYAKDAAGIQELYDGIDGVEAINPYDGADAAMLVTNLQWSMGFGAVNNDVYFGTDYNTVLNASIASHEYKGRQPAAEFTLNTLKRFFDYFWRIDQIDAAGNVTRGPVWRFTTGNGRGAITREVWTNISGNYVTNLTGNVNYPDNPNLTEIIPSFEGPTNWAENYGSRIHGFLIPPATGSYTFWIASDDYSELWLSTDANPVNTVKIAYAYGATGSREWTKYASQKSAAVSLTAGKPYYIMALHKEGAVGDNIAVAFSGSGISQEVIPGRYLMPYAADYDWGPTFADGSLYGIDAFEGSVYQDTVAGTASAMDGGAVTYAKAAGPLWLQVSADGTLSGIPGDGDTGSNLFDIRATDTQGASGTTTLQLDVQNAFTGELGLDDFAQLAARWMMSDCLDIPSCEGADLTGDGAVNLADLMSMTNMWLIEKSYGGLLAAWPFDADASDSISGYDGILLNGAAIDTDLPVLGSGALSLDGIDDYVEIPNFKGITGTASRTCTAWIKTTKPSSQIISWGSSDLGAKWTLRVNENGTLRAEVAGGYIYGVTNLCDDRWHHVAVVLNDDGSPDISEAVLYVDGQPESVGGVLPYSVNTAISNDVLIGVNLTGTVFFQGLIDEVQVFDRALTAAEILPLASIPQQLYLPLDETDGTTAMDRSGFNRSGELQGDPLWQPADGQVNGALSLDGIDDYIRITGYKGISGPVSRTCMAWVKTTKLNSQILNWGTTLTGEKWTLRVNEDGTFRTEVQGGYIYGTTSIADGVWHHVAVVLYDDGSPDISEAVLYVDGQPESVGVVLPCPINTSAANDIKIGVDIFGTNNFFQGLIDDVRIFSTALSEAEIQAML
jgi:hypothetical protein